MPKPGETHRRTACLLLLLLLTGGCDSGKDGATVSGQITADGRPVTGAVVTFEPVAPTTGPKASAPVADGRYEIGRDGGLHGGTYRIRIAMMPEELLSAMRAEIPDAFPPAGAVIAPEFDSRSELTRELDPQQPNQLDFEVSLLPPR